MSMSSPDSVMDASLKCLNLIKGITKLPQAHWGLSLIKCRWLKVWCYWLLLHFCLHLVYILLVWPCKTLHRGYSDFCFSLHIVQNTTLARPRAERKSQFQVLSWRHGVTHWKKNRSEKTPLLTKGKESISPSYEAVFTLVHLLPDCTEMGLHC